MPLDHTTFLDKIRETPAETAGWLVYADWLDEQDDPTGTFVRLSLDFTAGRVPIEPRYAHTERMDKLARVAHAPTRELLTQYRSGLPLRVQVCDCLTIGQDPPREMFGYARTIVVVTVLAGRIARGTWLRSEDGTWCPSRPVSGMEVFMNSIDLVEAGKAPAVAGLFYFGHHSLPSGTILVEGAPLERAP